MQKVKSKIKINIENINDNYEVKLKTLIDTLDLKINEISNEVTVRKSKISFKDVLYFITLMNAKNEDYISANCDIQIKTDLNVCQTAFCYHRQKINADYFKELAHSINKLIYNKNYKRRYIAVDGSQLYLVKSLSNEKFKLGRNKQYSICMLHSLFDVTNGVPIDLSIFKHKNETKALLTQLKYLKKGDVLIFDRGYFSKELAETLNSLGIDFIFRCKKNLTIFKNMDYDSSKIINNYLDDKKTKLRCIKYKVDNPNNNDDDEYYILTSLLKTKIKTIKNLYNSRWTIETNFKSSPKGLCPFGMKYDLSLSNIRSKKENTVKQDVYIHQFICSLYCYINSMIKKKDKHHLHKSKCLDIITDEILKLILYNENKIDINIKEICKLLNILKKTQIKIKKNRHCPRIRNKPYGKWCFKGKRYGIKKKEKDKNKKKTKIKIEIAIR